MRVAILANDDMTGSLIFSPLVGLSGVEIVGIVFSESAMKARKSMLSAAFGLRRKMAFRYWAFLVVSNGLFMVYSRLAAALRLPGSYGDLDSLAAHAARAGIPVRRCADFNAPALKDMLRNLGVELLLIRVSAILDAEMLSIPGKGTWCVHSSLLPAYGGIAGEFQALRRGEGAIGSTVFEVTPKLDEGPPLGQVSLPARRGRSLFSHIVANNKTAGALLAAMVTDLSAGRAPERPLLNAGVEPSYFSWPREEQVAEFRGKGWRLMSVAETLKLGLSALRLGPVFARLS